MLPRRACYRYCKPALSLQSTRGASMYKYSTKTSEPMGTVPVSPPLPTYTSVRWHHPFRPLSTRSKGQTCQRQQPSTLQPTPKTNACSLNTEGSVGPLILMQTRCPPQDRMMSIAAGGIQQRRRQRCSSCHDQPYHLRRTPVPTGGGRAKLFPRC